MTLPSLRSLFSFNTTGALSVLLVLAMLVLAWTQRQPLPVNAAVVQLPRLQEKTWDDEEALIAEIERRFAKDQQAMTLADELRISQKMEAAWNAQLPRDCGEHLAVATQLANTYPTLISPWRVLWRCWQTTPTERARLQRWIIALLRHSEKNRLVSARYPELGLKVHNFTDAMSYISLRGGEVIDAWFETLAAGQLLRVGVLFWDDEQLQDTRWYFDPISTQVIYAKSWNEDEECQAKLALCMVQHAPLSSYSAPTAIARGLYKQYIGQSKAAREEVQDQGRISAYAALLMFDWLSLDHDTLLGMDEIMRNARYAAEADSAEGKLLLSLLLNEEINTPELNGERAQQKAPGLGGAISWLFALNFADESADDERAKLWQEAQAELGQEDFEFLWAKYERHVNLMHWLQQAQISPDGKYPISEETWVAREMRWQQAAAAGSLDAMYQIVKELLESEREHKPEEYSYALDYLIRAANQKHREAMSVLGHLFMRDDASARQWVEYDLNKAEYWLRQAATLGHGGALENLVVILMAIPSRSMQQQQTLDWALQLGIALHLPKALVVAESQSELMHVKAPQAVRWLRWAAEQDNVDAQFNLGLCYLDGYGVTSDLSVAEYWLQKADQQGSAEAAFRLAQLMARPEQAEQKRRLAAVPLHRAANAGHARSQHLLGQWFEAGQLVQKNLPLAAHWFEQAVLQGDTSALRSHALSLERGYSSWDSGISAGKPDYVAAYQVWQQLAASGEPIGYTMMGAYHLLGAGVEVDHARALQLLQQGQQDVPIVKEMIRLLEREPEGLLAAARPLLQWADQEFLRLEQVPSGESPQQRQQRIALREHIIRWAEHYLVNWQLSPELTAALELWLGRGADAGFKDYAWWRAERHSNGGIWLNPDTCADYQRAWDAGQREAYILNQLCPRALEIWSQLPAAQRSPAGLKAGDVPIGERIELYRQAEQLQIPDAEFNLALVLYRASERSYNDPLGQEADRRMRELAKRGHAGAAFYVGAYREFTVGQLDGETLRYYRQAAVAGHLTAANNLGRLLMSTNAGFKNPELGWQWAYLAYLQGSASATDTLGEAHEYGWLGEPDWQQAVYYYDLAGAAGQGLSYLNAARLWIKGGHGLKEDQQRAVAYVTKAWEMGYLDEPRVDLGEFTVELTFGDTAPDA